MGNFYIRSSIFTLLSLATALVSYILYPILIRVLSPHAFGDFAVMTAIINQVLAVLLTVNVISIHLVKRYASEAVEHIQTVQKILLWMFMVLSVSILILSPFLSSALKLENGYLFILLAIILITNIPLVVWNGYLQGHKELVRIATSSLGSSMAKLILASMLGIIAGSLGALVGILAGTLTGMIILKNYPGIDLPLFKSALSRPNSKEVLFLKNYRYYIIQAVFVVGTIGFLQGLDITLSKILFEPDVAGQYSSIGVLGAAFYYLGFILVWIILPEINLNKPSVNYQVLKTAYKLFAAMLLIALLGELLLGNYMMEFVLGQRFTDMNAMLMFSTLYQSTLVALALYTFYLLVCRRKRSVVLAASLLITCAIIPPLFSQSPLTMIQLLWISLLIGSAAYFAALVAYSKITNARSI